MARYDDALQAVQARIRDACARAGRRPDEVTLLAVSKTFEAAAISAVHAAGQTAFGENYVQEAAAKRTALASLKGLHWVLIGPLQSNKAALAAEVFDRVESVDRLKIAQRLSMARGAALRPLEVLVQANISEEASKSGVAVGEAVALARAVSGLPRLAFRGFMGIAQPGIDSSAQFTQFSRLRACRDEARAQGLAADILSMGMSDDLEAAIAAGSTQVRVGSALFGTRAPRSAPDAT